MWLVAFAAANCWLFSLGAWGGILAVVIDKHVLVAYLCMKADVDRRARRTLVAESEELLQKRLTGRLAQFVSESLLRILQNSSRVSGCSQGVPEDGTPSGV